MMPDNDFPTYTSTADAPHPAAAYVAPAIEQTINAEEIEREVHYAGGLTCPTCNRMP